MWKRLRKAWEITRQCLSVRTLLDMFGWWKPIVALVVSAASAFVAHLEGSSPFAVGIIGLAMLIVLLLVLKLDLNYKSLPKFYDPLSQERARLACNCLLCD